MSLAFRSALAALLICLSVASVAVAYDPRVTPPGHKACSGSFGPNGEPGTGFYMHLKAKRTSCAEARKVIRGFLRSDATTGPTRIRGFRCTQRTVKLDEDDPNGGGLVVCTRDGGRAVRAYGHP